MLSNDTCYINTADPSDVRTAEGTFYDSGDCEFEIAVKDPGTYSCTLKYVQAMYDGYYVPESGNGALEFDVNTEIAATPTQVPTAEPTEVPVTEEPGTPEPEITAAPTPEHTAELSPAPSEEKRSEEATVPFGMLEVLTVLLSIAVIITIVLIIKLTRRSRR